MFHVKHIQKKLINNKYNSKSIHVSRETSHLKSLKKLEIKLA